MALSADTIYEDQGKDGFSTQIVNTARPYVGSVVQIGHVDHATAANRGRLAPWTGGAGEIPSGWAMPDSTTGNTGATPIPEQPHDLRGFVRRVTVTGASAVTDAGRSVYASDDGTFTLTRSASRPLPLGRVMRWISGTTCRVYFYSVEGLDILAYGGSVLGEWHFPISGLFAAAGNAFTGFVARFHGAIISEYLVVAQVLTGGGASLTFNSEIGGTNVTGSAVIWAAGDAQGAKVAGAAITAANVFHEGDLIDIEAAVGTAGTGGLATYVIEYERRLGV